MDITPLGWITIPIGLLLFFSRRRWLFTAVILVIPFFNTSVLYFAPLTFVLRTPFYFLVLYIVRLILDKAVQPSNRLRIYRSSENWWLLVWLSIGSISLISSLSLSGKVLVHPIEGSAFPEWHLLQFGTFNFTQLAYWFFFALVFLGLVTSIRSVRDIKQIIRWITIASLVVLASGLFAQGLFSLGYDKLVVAVFRFMGATSIDYRSIGSLPRMYSLAGEPGYTGFLLAFSMGLILIPVISRKDAWLWSRKANITAVLLLAMGVILSTGTSGYLALLIIVMVGFIILILQYKPAIFVSITLKWTGISILLGAILLVLFKGVWDISFFQLLMNTQIDKLLGRFQSGPVRLQFISDALSISWRHPLLGVGIGGNKAFALIPALLSNIGFLGTGAFLVFNGAILSKAFRVFKTTKSVEVRAICSSLIITFVGMFSVMAVGKSLASVTYPWYWLLLALMTGIYLVETKGWEQTQP